MVYIYTIEGNIGSGKSTFVEILKLYYENNKNIIFLQEPVNIWETIKDENNKSILEKFYEDQKKYAFSFQMMAYISRVAMLKECIKNNKDKTIICERSVLTDKNVFAKMLYDSGNIEDINYQIYLKWFNEFIEELPIEGIIYVKAEPEISYERVIKRSRKGEIIPLTYLKECHNYHEQWLNRTNIKILSLDANYNKEYNKENYNEWIIRVNNFIKLKNIYKTTNKSICDNVGHCC
jgi:deoxyadenosine/deoxycytidine kinase